ncbi:MAG: hypothetical protein BWK75_02035 [Candidatus Altiarchaeales archaeon A3]|nr:MAG: hypothetical protein BWK75_02035 [Candidatus Altiarchaeales archaeon A3]
MDKFRTDEIRAIDLCAGRGKSRYKFMCVLFLCAYIAFFLLPLHVDAISGTIGGEYFLETPAANPDYATSCAYNDIGQYASGGFYVVGLYDNTFVEVFMMLYNGSEVLFNSTTIDEGAALDFFTNQSNGGASNIFEIKFWHIVATKPVYVVSGTAEGTNVQLPGATTGSNKDVLFFNHITSSCWLKYPNNYYGNADFGGTYIFATENDTLITVSYLDQQGNFTNLIWNGTLDASEYKNFDIDWSLSGSKGGPGANEFTGSPYGYKDARTIKINSSKPILAGRYANDNDQQHWTSSVSGLWSGKEFGIFMNWDQGVGAFVSNPTNETVIVQAWNYTNTSNLQQIGGPVSLTYSGTHRPHCPECVQNCTVEPYSVKRCMFTAFCDMDSSVTCIGSSKINGEALMFVKFNSTNDVYMTAGGLREPNSAYSNKWRMPPVRPGISGGVDLMFKLPPLAAGKYSYYRPYDDFGYYIHREDCGAEDAIINITPYLNIPVNNTQGYSWGGGGGIEADVSGENGLYLHGRNVTVILYTNTSGNFSVVYDPICTQSEGTAYCNYTFHNPDNCNISYVATYTYTYGGRTFNKSIYSLNASCEFGVNILGKIRITNNNGGTSILSLRNLVIKYAGFVDLAMPGADAPSGTRNNIDCMGPSNQSVMCDAYARQWLINLTSPTPFLVYIFSHISNDMMTLQESNGPYTIYSTTATPNLLENKGAKTNITISITNYGTKNPNNLIVNHIIPKELSIVMIPDSTIQIILINFSGVTELNFTINDSAYCTPTAFNKDNLSQNGTICVYENPSTHVTTIRYLLSRLDGVNGGTPFGSPGDILQLKYTARLDETNPSGEISLSTAYNYQYCSPFIYGGYRNETRFPADVKISVPQIDVLKEISPANVTVGESVTIAIYFLDPLLKLENVTVTDEVYTSNLNYSNNATIRQLNGTAVYTPQHSINATNYTELLNVGKYRQNITFNYSTISELANIPPGITTIIEFQSIAVNSSNNISHDCAVIKGFAVGEHNNSAPIDARACYKPPQSSTFISKNMSNLTLGVNENATVTLTFHTSQNFTWEAVDFGDILPKVLLYADNAWFYNGSEWQNVSDCRNFTCYVNGTGTGIQIKGPYFTKTIEERTKFYWTFFSVGNISNNTPWKLNFTVTANASAAMESATNYGYYTGYWNKSTKTDFAKFLPPVRVYAPFSYLFKLSPPQIAPNSSVRFSIHFENTVLYADMYNIIINDTFGENLTFVSAEMIIGNKTITLINETSGNCIVSKLPDNRTNLYTNYTMIPELQRLNRTQTIVIYLNANSTSNKTVNTTQYNASMCDEGVRNNIIVIWEMGGGLKVTDNTSTCPLSHYPFFNVTKFHTDISELLPGDMMNFTINVTSGEENISNLKIIDYLPKRLKYINATFTLFINGIENKTNLSIDPANSSINNPCIGNETQYFIFEDWGSNLNYSIDYANNYSVYYNLPANSTLLLNLTVMAVLCENNVLPLNLTNYVYATGAVISYNETSETQALTNLIAYDEDNKTINLRPPILTCAFSVLPHIEKDNSYEIELTMTESNSVPLYNLSHAYKLYPGLNLTSVYLKIYNDTNISLIEINISNISSSDCVNISGNSVVGTNITFNYSNYNSSSSLCPELEKLSKINSSTVATILLNVTALTNTTNATGNGFAYSKDGTLLSCRDMYWYKSGIALPNVNKTANPKNCTEPGNYINYSIAYVYKENIISGLMFIKDKYPQGFKYIQTNNITINGTANTSNCFYMDDENGRVLIWKFENLKENETVVINYTMYENSSADDDSINKVNIQIGSRIYSNAANVTMRVCKPIPNATKTGSEYADPGDRFNYTILLKDQSTCDCCNVYNTTIIDTFFSIQSANISALKPEFIWINNVSANFTYNCTSNNSLCSINISYINNPGLEKLQKWNKTTNLTVKIQMLIQGYEGTNVTNNASVYAFMNDGTKINTTSNTVTTNIKSTQISINKTIKEVCRPKHKIVMLVLIRLNQAIL